MPEYIGTWKEIWTQKGEMEGTVEDILVYDGWEKSNSKIEDTAKRIIDILDIKKEDRVLEVGCGAGGMAQYLDCEYVGIDFSKPLTKRCMEFFKLPAIYAEADDIPFKDNYFDKVFSWGCFLYFPSLEYAEGVVREMKRVVKKNEENHSILIGDLPLKSHNNRHCIYERGFFEKRGFQILSGWTEPYCNERFNAVC